MNTRKKIMSTREEEKKKETRDGKVKEESYLRGKNKKNSKIRLYV